MTTTFQFFGDLPELLKRKWREKTAISIEVDRRTSIKDMLESFGLPHTEVGSIKLQGEEVDFNLLVEDGGLFDVYPVEAPWDVTRQTILRSVPLPAVSFIVDVNAGRLARYLRAAGFDTLYDHRWRDDFIAEMMHHEQRILLTRDMRLLMRKQVVFGRYVRATHPVEQLQEVIKLFGVKSQIAPFSRCLECNAPLTPVAKEKIVHRLEPLTKKYYSSFSSCVDCDKIYWRGSHIERMKKLLSGQLDT